MNVPLYEKVLDIIKTHPELWEQNDWDSICGTKHCFAGWAVALTEDQYQAEVIGYFKTAKDALDLTQKQAEYLFNPDRTLSDFDKFLEKTK